MGYFDLHTHPENFEKFLKYSEFFGWEGFAHIFIVKSLKDFEIVEEKIKKWKEEKGNLSVFYGVEIFVEEPKDLRKIINEIREKTLLIIVHGGDYRINLEAVSNPKVDILAHPELDRNDNGLDENCFKLAKENNVLIEVNFYQILKNKGYHRAKIIQNISENIRLAQEIGTDIIITSGARSHWDIRDPRALASVANVLGLDLGKAIDSVSDIPEKLIETNLKKLKGLKPDKGVEVIEE